METENVKIGGMAQVDGIMFKSKNNMVTVRKKDDFISLSHKKIHSLLNLKVFRIPFLRGVISIMEMPFHIVYNFFWGLKNKDKFKKKISIKKLIQFSLSIFIFICFLVGFVVVFVFLSNWISKFITMKILTRFLAFIPLIAVSVALYDILFGKQMLQYHGAEHKIIYTYMQNKELTVNNVKQSPKENVRCGSSFIMWLFIFILFTPFRLTWWLILIYISISYEFISFASENEKSIISRIIKIPGYLIQLFVTREPTSDQIRTGLMGFKELLRIDGLVKK